MKKGSPRWAPLWFRRSAVRPLPGPSPLRGGRRSLRVFDGPRLADHCDPDLAWKAKLRFDSLSDVSRHQLGSRVVDLLRLDQDPNLAAGLDGVRLLDALERVGDFLQLFQPLDVGLERLTPSTGASRRDGVCRDQQERLDRMWFFVVVMRTHCVHDRGRYPMSLQQVCPDDGMRTLDLVVDGLADVVEQARHLGDANVGADLGRHHGGEISDLFRMIQHLLAVAGTETQDAEMTDDFRV